MNPFVEFRERYGEQPELFVREVLAAIPDGWQGKVLSAYAERKRRISIRSCHGPGKTAVVAWIAIHHILFRYPQKTVATAPSSPQAFDAFYSEVKHWCKKLPPTLQELLVIKADRTELKSSPQSSFLSVRTSRSDQPEALQGIHSKHVLLIVDEASGVPEAVYEAASGSMSGENACTILISNPTKTSGLFFDTHNSLKGSWFTTHVSHEDSPRVSNEFVDEMKQRYGEESNAYRVRVLGEFPLTDEDTVIPFHLIEEARVRVLKPAMTGVGIVWGVDVARFGNDRNALAKRQGSIVLEKLKVWNNCDLMQTVGIVKNEWDKTPLEKRPRDIFVDAIGLGAGVSDRLREMGLPARAVNVSESPAMKETYRNLRSEIWFLTREWLQSRVASLPEDDYELCKELGLPRYSYTSSGKLLVESKAEIKKRHKPSPDLAEALILTFARGGAILAYGKASSWGGPLKRNIKGVV